MMSAYDKIYAIVRQIPAGQLATYGQVAELADLPGRARLVGYALYHVDIQSLDIPWHRVINAKGEISHSPLRYGSDHWQRSLLEAEGIQFSPEGKVKLQAYQWQPKLQKSAPETELFSSGADSGETSLTKRYGVVGVTESGLPG